MKIEKDKQLKEFTTFKIGGPAQFFCSVTNESELEQAVSFARENRLDVFTLGGGSNILVRDEGFAGLVIKMEIKGVEYSDDENGDTRVVARAGENWDELVENCVKRGLFGIENLSYIPGTVGAAPVQNIGAYGSEIKDVLESVRAYDTVEGGFKEFLNNDCRFEYRNSLFKKESGRYIITSVTLILSRIGKVNTDYRDLKEYFGQTEPTLADVRNAVITIRKKKLPDVNEVGTAGSFFKNPIISRSVVDDLKNIYPELPVYPVNAESVKVSLAWIIDRACNFKGVARGDVGTYKNQALVIVNNGNATAADVLSFADEIKKTVKEKTGIDAEFEVQVI